MIQDIMYQTYTELFFVYVNLSQCKTTSGILYLEVCLKCLFLPGNVFPRLLRCSWTGSWSEVCVYVCVHEGTQIKLIYLVWQRWLLKLKCYRTFWIQMPNTLWNLLLVSLKNYTLVCVQYRPSSSLVPWLWLCYGWIWPVPLKWTQKNITGPHVLLLQGQIIPLNIFWKKEILKTLNYMSKVLYKWDNTYSYFIDTHLVLDINTLHLLP